jgi:hypothetical protein
MKTASKISLATVLAASLAAGCQGPSARVKSGDEGTVVDVRRGGTETYEQLIHDGVTELLDTVKAQLVNSSTKPLIAFVGVENRSSEELGEFRASMNNEIETAIMNHGIFVMISRRAVDAAKRGSNVRDAADLTTAGPREAFMAVLNKDGHPPQYLLFGEVSTMTSSGNKASERTYELTLQLMDSSNGVIQAQKLVKVRKEYTK